MYQVYKKKLFSDGITGCENATHKPAEDSVHPNRLAVFLYV